MILPSFKNSKVLTKEREKELLILNSKGDMAAREELVKNNQYLVLNIASRYRRYLSFNIEGTFEDLIQEGNIGLIRAIDKFNLKKKVHLNTYAIYWINQKIRKFLESKTLLIHIPANIQSRYKKLVWKLRSNPNFKISEKDKIFFDKLGIKIDVNGSISYLTCGFEKATDQKYLYSFNKDIDKLYEEDAVKKYILGLRELTKNQRQILIMRIGIGCPPMSFLEIGKVMNRKKSTIKNSFEHSINVLRGKYKKDGPIL